MELNIQVNFYLGRILASEAFWSTTEFTFIRIPNSACYGVHCTE